MKFQRTHVIVSNSRTEAKNAILRCQKHQLVCGQDSYANKIHDIPLGSVFLEFLQWMRLKGASIT